MVPMKPRRKKYDCKERIKYGYHTIDIENSWCIEIFAIMPSDAKAVMHWIFSYISGKIIVIGS